MYKNCVFCPKLGVSCDGPNFVAMAPSELIEWCKQRKKHVGMSREKLADASGIPKGTIDRLFAGKSPDFKYETIRPMLRVLVGGAWEERPCVILAEPQVVYRDNPETLNELERVRGEQQRKIDYLIKENKFKDELLQDRAYEARRKNRYIAILVGTLAVCLLLIIGSLIIDRLNPSIGFFWLER